MKKAKLFNMEITLNCSQCGMECPLEDPLNSIFPVTIEERLSLGINKAWAEHAASGKCKSGRSERVRKAISILEELL